MDTLFDATALGSVNVVGDYELFRILGEGGIATTWLGRDIRDGRLVAVKCLQLVRAKNRMQIDLFEREAEALKSLRHRQIPAFFETLLTDTDETIKLYLVHEFIEGRSLRKMLEDGDSFSAHQVVRIMLSCLEPLEYLHQMAPPLFHRDIKPSNVILRQDGTCVLIDFGAVREALVDPNSGASSVVGTFGYMAPEQFQARAVPATDLYSLGATAVHLLSRRAPSTYPVRRLKPDIHQFLTVDPHLAAIFDLLLEPAAEDRYQSVSSLKRALTRWLSEHPEKSTREETSTELGFPSATGSEHTLDVPVQPSASAVLAETPAELISAVGGDETGAATKAPAGADPKLAGRRPELAAAEPGAPAAEPAPGVGVAPLLGDDAGEAGDLDAFFSGDPAVAHADVKPRVKKPKPRSKKKRKTAKRGTSSKKAPTNRPAGVSVIKTSDPWSAAFKPVSVGYAPMGLIFLGLAAIFASLALFKKAQILPATAVAGALFVYGLTYFIFAARHRSRDDSLQFITNTDGILTRIDMVTTLFGETYVVLHYRFGVAEKVYEGSRTFNNRDQALPFLKRALPEMVWFDEDDPTSNTLDLPENI